MIYFNDKPPEKFTDGILRFGVIKTKRYQGKKIGEEFQETGHLFFNKMSVRQSDYELLAGTDQNIDLKVKTFFILGVSKESHKVQINNEEYDIYMLDSDADDKYLYWYLTKAGRLNG